MSAVNKKLNSKRNASLSEFVENLQNSKQEFKGQWIPSRDVNNTKTFVSRLTYCRII